MKIEDFFNKYNNSTKEYVHKYWIRNDENYQSCLKLQKKVFAKNTNSDLGYFNNGYELSVLAGGNILSEDGLNALKSFMKITGDSNFYIIEDYDEMLAMDLKEMPIPPVRLKYPSTISWDAINKKDEIISELLYNWGNGNYYVYGSSANWGRYIAIDAIYPFDVWGYKKAYKQDFEKCFSKIIAESDDIFSETPELIFHIPSVYREAIHRDSVSD